ncbi:MAG: ABC transporter permease, partial [Chloroflexota bacterium]|nr:ABC transporter permease [Chloroflexota bacterium]
MARQVANAPLATPQAARVALGAGRRSRDGFWFRFRRQPGALFGIAALLLLLCMALFAAVIAPGDPFATSRQVFLPPSASHPFGTDDLGRDLFRSVIHGARASLLVGVATTIISTAIGVLVGACAGYFGGWVDDVLMRLTELFQVVPRFFLILITVALFGSGIQLIILLLGLTYWPGAARLLRGQVLSLRTREHVVAARALGVREPVILVRHVLPMALPPIITLAALTVGGAILVEAGLSFLGLGDRNVVSWGALL